MTRLPGGWHPGVYALLAGQGLMNAGFFMLFPLLTVHLTVNLGFDATSAGLVLAARMLIQQGAAPLGGALSDRVGYKPAIVAGFAIRTAGFLLFAISSDLVGVLAGALVTALGGTLFDPPSRAALAYLTPERERQAVYAASGTVGWLGQVVGPLLGALLLPVSFFWVSVAAAAAFLLAAAQAALFLPGGMRGQGLAGLTVWGSIGAALRDPEFARFTALLLGYYFVMVQTIITVPLLVNRVAGAAAIGVIFAIQAGTALLLQVPLTRWAARRAGPLAQMAASMAVAAVGFLVYTVADSLALLALATVLVAGGQILVMPAQSTITARLAGGQGGAYFGVSALALAVGGAVGQASGGLVMDLSLGAGVPWLPWVAMAGIALLTALGFGRLAGNPRLRARLAPSVARARLVP